MQWRIDRQRGRRQQRWHWSERDALPVSEVVNLLTMSSNVDCADMIAATAWAQYLPSEGHAQERSNQCSDYTNFRHGIGAVLRDLVVMFWDEGRKRWESFEAVLWVRPNFCDAEIRKINLFASELYHCYGEDEYLAATRRIILGIMNSLECCQGNLIMEQGCRMQLLAKVTKSSKSSRSRMRGGTRRRIKSSDH